MYTPEAHYLSVELDKNKGGLRESQGSTFTYLYVIPSGCEESVVHDTRISQLIPSLTWDSVVMTGDLVWSG